MRTPSLLHFTLGGVWMEEPGSLDYGELWKQYRDEMNNPYDPNFVRRIDEAVKHRTGPMSFQEAVRRGHI